MTSIYDARQKLKMLFTGLAVIIAIGSFIITESLVKRLSREEQTRMEIWANATKELVRMNEDCDITFVQQVIEANTTIPVVLVDAKGNALSYRNIEVQSEKELPALILDYKKKNAPIVINLGDNQIQRLYYGNSVLLTYLSYFPFIQLIAVFLFLVFVIWALLSTKKAEQNKVWVGLSKETAHQLGTPISSLMAWTEILKTKYPEDPLLFEMEKDVSRLRTIAERFSQIGSKTELELVNLNQALADTLQYLRTRLSKKVDIQLNMEDEVFCHINISLFEWVIENLCKNAVDAMDGEGKINISLLSRGKEIRIDVADSGKGMTKKNMRKIFNPGFTTKKRGWGLGLSLAKRIVEDYHKGKIFVRKTEVGKGTVFRIVFYRESEK